MIEVGCLCRTPRCAWIDLSFDATPSIRDESLPGYQTGSMSHSRALTVLLVEDGGNTHCSICSASFFLRMVFSA